MICWLAVSCLTTDWGILAVVFLLYGITYTLGGEMGVRTTTGIISLLIDSLQTLCYDVIALAAWTIAILCVRDRVHGMVEHPRNNAMLWLSELYRVMLNMVESEPSKSIFLVSVIFLGTFYLVYSANTFIGIIAFTYKSLFPQVIPLVEFFNPSSRLAYVYLTGPNPYLHSLDKLNRVCAQSLRLDESAVPIQGWTGGQSFRNGIMHSKSKQTDKTNR
eukprot:GHVH01004330.1.p1 GENE.GHVH01004330.1~~GHVH01004330.1.p1  ORF type:complete len:218 (+),score=17.33 GHVH01004330.1:322-975(+)